MCVCPVVLYFLDAGSRALLVCRGNSWEHASLKNMKSEQIFIFHILPPLPVTLLKSRHETKISVEVLRSCLFIIGCDPKIYMWRSRLLVISPQGEVGRKGVLEERRETATLGTSRHLPRQFQWPQRHTSCRSPYLRSNDEIYAALVIEHRHRSPHS